MRQTRLTKEADQAALSGIYRHRQRAEMAVCRLCCGVNMNSGYVLGSFCEQGSLCTPTGNGFNVRSWLAQTHDRTEIVILGQAATSHDGRLCYAVNGGR